MHPAQDTPMVSHLASAAGLTGPCVMSQDPPGTPEASPAACAAEALRLLQAHAYFADRVDWMSVTAEVSRAVDQGASLGWALRPVWRELGDRHSFLRPAESSRAPVRPGDVPAGRRLPANLGYLRLPGIATGTRTAAALEYVAAAWAWLRELPRPSGGVLDLRGNGGGNIVPMLAAALVPGREGGVAEARAWLNTQHPR